MAKAHLFLALLWIIFSVLHSVLASLSFKKMVASWMGNAYKHYRIFYTLFAFASLGVVFYYQVTIPSFLIYSPSTATYVLGAVIAITGLIIMGICIKKYFLSLSGLKSLFQERPIHQLMINGIHKYVRHPLYLGTFAFIWGLLLLIPYFSLFIANFIITTYTLIGIELEEKKLNLEFGDDYKTYQQQVPKLFPFTTIGRFITVQRRKQRIHRF